MSGTKDFGKFINTVVSSSNKKDHLLLDQGGVAQLAQPHRLPSLFEGILLLQMLLVSSIVHICIKRKALTKLASMPQQQGRRRWQKANKIWVEEVTDSQEKGSGRVGQKWTPYCAQKLASERLTLMQEGYWNLLVSTTAHSVKLASRSMFSAHSREEAGNEKNNNRIGG